MLSQRLNTLGERLLSGGVAPRHVRRYLCELRNHYEDALREELAKGGNSADAERLAWARLGNEDHLAQSMLSRPELRSLASRHPRMVFGAGPVTLWLGLFSCNIMILIYLKDFLRLAGLLPPSSDPAWAFGAFASFAYFYVRILPTALALLAVLYAIRHRLSLASPIVGAAVILAASYTMTFGIIPATTVGQQTELTFNWSLIPFLLPFTDLVGKMNGSDLMEGLAHAAFILAAIMVPTLLWRKYTLERTRSS